MENRNKQAEVRHSDFIESLNLDQLSKQVEALKETLFNTPDIDHPRVEAIKQKLQSSDYKIHSHQIAHKLTEHVTLNQERLVELA